MGKISIPEENGVNLPTRKRIISSFSTPETMRFLIFKIFCLAFYLLVRFTMSLVFVSKLLAKKKNLPNYFY